MRVLLGVGVLNVRISFSWSRLFVNNTLKTLLELRAAGRTDWHVCVYSIFESVIFALTTLLLSALNHPED